MSYNAAVPPPHPHADWVAAAAAVAAERAAAAPATGRAELLAQDPRAPLRTLEALARRLRMAHEDAAALARDGDAALRAAASLAAQGRLWASWGAEDGAAARPEVVGASAATLVGVVTTGTTALTGLVARFEARRGGWRGEAPAYVARLAETAEEVAAAIAALRHADRWP